MLKHSLMIAILFAGGAFAAQQEQAPAPQKPEGKPQVKVNYLNVCTPDADEQAILKSVLATVQAKPEFSTDFELSRGRTTLKDAPDSKFVRLRRDFVSAVPLMTAQYSMSSDSTNTIELLVLHARDPKEFLEISMEDRVSAGAALPGTVLSVDTPVTRIRIERLGKSSVALARCQEVDQSAYDPFFNQASEIMSRYRNALGLRTEFRADIAWLNPAAAKSGTRKPAKKRGSAPNPAPGKP
ncbi:MAG TPA: hypothetical protein VFT65_20990 [Candidatus Angelobacter sp.]|nr:hypothetical protein [Candidatus Angelobacter sp.]